MKKREKEVQNELKGLINNEDIWIPESLSQKKIEGLLKSAKQNKKKTSVFKTVISVTAAAAVLAISVTAGIKYLNSTPEHMDMPESEGNEIYGSAPIKNAENYEEIENYFLEIKKQYSKEELKDKLNSAFSFGQKNSSAEIAPEYSGSDSSGSLNDMAGNAAGNSQDTNTSAGLQPEGYGKTNIQVEGIDEADIIKNDGEYLYIVSESAKKLFIVKAAPAEEMKTVSEISFKENYSIDEIYLNDNKLITVGSFVDNKTSAKSFAANGTAEIYEEYAGVSRTAVTVYDISDRTSPKELKLIEFDGMKISTRLLKDKLITACNYAVPIYKEEETLKKKCIPSYYLSGERSFVPFQSIKILDSLKGKSNFLIIGIVDLTKLDDAPQVTAVLGGGENAYCDNQNLYFTISNYSEGTETRSADGNTVSYTPGKQSTGIFMFDITGGAPQYKAYGEVGGAVDDQFSMDKNGGYFRIATTDSSEGSKITVLDEKLQMVGEIGGLSKGERIYAVRFIGNTAYVITFRQTDPLLIIDLSDPENPTLKGELKIPGFSDYLHPYSENLLIGIGYDGTESGTNGKMKVSLFDVSNPERPEEISKIIFNGMSVSSPAAYNHKAFLWFPYTKEFAIPVIKYDNTGAIASYLSIMTVGQDNKLNITGSYGEKESEFKAASEILRGTYIEDVIYTLSDSRVTAYDKKSQRQISSLLLTDSSRYYTTTAVNEYNDVVY